MSDQAPYKVHPQATRAKVTQKWWVRGPGRTLWPDGPFKSHALAQAHCDELNATTPKDTPNDQ